MCACVFPQLWLESWKGVVGASKAFKLQVGFSFDFQAFSRTADAQTTMVLLGVANYVKALVKAPEEICLRDVVNAVPGLAQPKTTFDILYATGVCTWAQLGSISERQWKEVLSNFRPMVDREDLARNDLFGPGHMSLINELREVAQDHYRRHQEAEQAKLQGYSDDEESMRAYCGDDDSPLPMGTTKSTSSL